MAEDGVHMAVPGSPPTAEQLKRMTQAYQKQIRNSALWDMMVKQFGNEKAEEMVKRFQVKLS
jgi:NADH:ubiquinone oxidoreductase subunit B-like Fe-S oxidoreductase